MAQVGDIIKSYDFPSRTDCYMIGKVTSVEGHSIQAITIIAISEDKVVPHATYFNTYEQGTLLLDDADKPRIIVVA